MSCRHNPLVRDNEGAFPVKITDDLAEPAQHATTKNDAGAGLEIEWKHHR
jgi:hypothetical protein